MSPDNSQPGMFPVVKSPSEVDPPRTQSGRGLNTERTLVHPIFNQASPSRSSYSTGMPFVPRPFPPPSLAEVPFEYILDQLRQLAPHYWNKPETADCTIIVPVPHGQRRSMRAPEASPLPSERRAADTMGGHIDPLNLGRRVTEPNLKLVPRVSFKLHMDYLSAQSTFLRALFSGASPLDLINTSPSATFSPNSNQLPRPSGSRFHVPANRMPRLLPCSPSHPILFLPLPDPTSFQPLLHWMYFGNTDHIRECLHRGVVEWEGLARNVEYLGLSTEMKVFLGRWYGTWLHPGRLDPACKSEFDEDSDQDDDSSDPDEGSATMDADILSTVSEDVRDHVADANRRGRSRSVRHIQSSPAEFNRRH